jgi:hypothetical protein
MEVIAKQRRRGDVRVGHLFEELGIAAFIGVQPQGPAARRKVRKGELESEARLLLFAIGLLEVYVRGIGAHVEEIVKFSEQRR